MSKYLDKSTIAQLAEECQPFLPLRNKIYNTYGIDPLDTDTLSSLEIYQIVSQYDSDYNVNFARNGEDAQSGSVLIEQKCTKVPSNTTKTGKNRKAAGTDAAFTFHAMGDIEYPRYIFVARFKDNLGIDRLYDISEPANVAIVQQYLLAERKAWLARGRADPAKMKRDAIVIPEKVLLTQLAITKKMVIDDCTVFRA